MNERSGFGRLLRVVPLQERIDAERRDAVDDIRRPGETHLEWLTRTYD
jgi:hypothetical protein